MARRNPAGPWRFLNMPLFFSSTSNIPAATAIKCHSKYLPTNNSYATWSVIGFTFNYLIKRRHLAWCSRYNCELLFGFSNCSDVTSAGLDSGLAISVLVIFLTLSLPKSGINFNWWGNIGAFNTAVLSPPQFCSYCSY